MEKLSLKIALFFRGNIGGGGGGGGGGQKCSLWKFYLISDTVNLYFESSKFQGISQTNRSKLNSKNLFKETLSKNK